MVQETAVPSIYSECVCVCTCVNGAVIDGNPVPPPRKPHLGRFWSMRLGPCLHTQQIHLLQDPCSAPNLGFHADKALPPSEPQRPHSQVQGQCRAYHLSAMKPLTALILLATAPHHTTGSHLVLEDYKGVLIRRPQRWDQKIKGCKQFS